MVVPIVLFGLTALGGLTLATIRLAKDANPPKAFAIVHGLLALAGLISLAVEAFAAERPGMVWIVFGVFVLAAVGGLYLARIHRKGETIPADVVVMHGVLALAAYGFFLFSVGLDSGARDDAGPPAEDQPAEIPGTSR